MSRSSIGGLLALAPLILAAHFSSAPCDRALRRLEGWTIMKVSTVRGTFNGCEYDKLVELTDGTVLRCASYGYQYAYMPDAVVFAKSVTAGATSAVMIRLMVEGELYDMAPAASR